MRINRVTWTGVRVPFRQPYVTSARSATHRYSLLVRIETDDGVGGLGEVAPVGPGSEAEVRELAHALAAAAQAMVGTGVRLRLDANGAWDVDEALAVLAALGRYDLEYVEQPTVTIAGLAAVRRASTVPIAADESLAYADDAAALIDAMPAPATCSS